jgi:hypothetical protein
MAVTVTNSTIAALNTVTATTRNLATADTDALAEVFTITPTAPDGKLLIVLDLDNLVATDAAAADATFSIAAGDFWAGAAVTGTVTKSTKKMIQVETAKVLQNDGTIALTLTPGASDKLLSNHAAAVEVFEIL